MLLVLGHRQRLVQNSLPLTFYEWQNWPTPQRGLSVIAELLVLNNGIGQKNINRCSTSHHVFCKISYCSHLNVFFDSQFGKKSPVPFPFQTILIFIPIYMEFLHQMPAKSHENSWTWSHTLLHSLKLGQLATRLPDIVQFCGNGFFVSFQCNNYNSSTRTTPIPLPFPQYSQWKWESGIPIPHSRLFCDNDT